MVRTASTMLPLGTAAPDFALRDTDGTIVRRDDFRDAKALLVVFMCNHCPYVKHVAPELQKLAVEYQQRGVAVVGISSNDVEAHPDDSPEKMAEEKASRGYTFPYLYDADQSVAKAYHAACTPDFYVFDSKLQLAYRGQMDSSRPKSDTPVTGEDLRTALDALLEGSMPPETQTPSIGCNIKWKSGSEPVYFNG
jgi:peroxiredoxin